MTPRAAGFTSGAAPPTWRRRRLGPQRMQLSLALPDLPPGWYDAQLLLSSQGQALGDKHIALVKLADDEPPSWPGRPFWAGGHGFAAGCFGALPEVLPLLAAGRVKLAVWSRDGDVQQLDPDHL